MQEDFHYYATYCAAYLAGYSHEDSLDICYAAQLVDLCSAAFLNRVKGPKSAATTQLQMEMMNARMDSVGLQNITRIWASFHFLPHDLYAQLPKRPRRYMNKYRLICDSNSDLMVETVKLAKDRPLPAVGVAMHVLADTWAHRYFAGTPSLVINNTNTFFYELTDDENEPKKKINFRHNPTAPDDLKEGLFTNTVYQSGENSIMNLGHGRAGHLPDYSFIRYQYLPAWANYETIVKDNPSDYYHAFCQMVYAMKYLNGAYDSFDKNLYDEQTVAPWESEIKAILTKRQLNACEDWKQLGERLSGQPIEDFDVSKYVDEYIHAEKKKKDDTYLGNFFLAAMAQKSMVTNKIFKSKNLLAGFSVDYRRFGIRGIKDFKKLAKWRKGEGKK